MAQHNLVTLSDDNFDAEVLKSALPVLVDFWAPWCGPCRAVAPVVEEIAGAMAGRLKVGKLNVDDNMRVAANYQITAIPTLLIFKNGQVVDQVVGALPKDRLLKVIERHL